MTNDDSLNDFYDWTYGTGAYDDNAGANPANANATAPIKIGRAHV